MMLLTVDGHGCGVGDLKDSWKSPLIVAGYGTEWLCDWLKPETGLGTE